MTLIEKRNLLFDDNFIPKIDNVDEIVEFCQELTDVTGIQCCTFYGAMFECVPAVYRSVIRLNHA